jgi:hypothetical protein
MPLNPSGRISIGGDIVGESINLELNLLADTNSSLNDPAFRALAGIPEGTISLADFYGKSNVIIIPPITTNTSNFTISPDMIPGYIPGETKAELSIGTLTYLYSTSTTEAALTIRDFVAGDQITIVNNGFLQGKGGKGGNSSVGLGNTAGRPGGNAITIINSTGASFFVVNNGFLLGGGGGGGGSGAQGGGGGAGGGDGGDGNSAAGFVPGGAGGGPGMQGSDGTTANPYYTTAAASGGGGGNGYGPGGASVRGYPGPGNQSGGFRWAGKGGYSGGSGAAYNYVSGPAYAGDGYSGAGGGYTNIGGTGYTVGPRYASNLMSFAGGGGGYGASGGSGAGTTLQPTNFNPGGVSGKAVNLNGATVTLSGAGTTAGAIS